MEGSTAGAGCGVEELADQGGAAVAGDVGEAVCETAGLPMQDEGMHT